MKVRSVLVMMIICSAVTCIHHAIGAELPEVKPSKSDWPWWRGPTRDGKAAAGQKPPVSWSETKNILWKTPIQGRGHGSPTIWGDKIFLNTAVDEKETQYTICLDRKNGKELWKKAIHKNGYVRSHTKNSHASGTPACDGERVFVAFATKDSVQLTALDFKGEQVWQKKVNAFKSKHGYAVSPTIYKSLVIVNAESDAGTVVVAFNRKTGAEVWRTPRGEIFTNFGSPSIGHSSGKDQLVFIGPKKVESYNPNNGKPLWSCAGPTDVGASTATFSKEFIYASGGYPKRALLAIKSDGKGDVTNTHLKWKIKGKTAYVTSLLLHEGLLYMVYDNSGLLRVIEAKTGAEVYQQELSYGCSASPILAGGNIYQADEKGNVTVFKPGRKFKKVAENNLNDGGFASPTICDSRIYLRTVHNLYCIGKK